MAYYLTNSLGCLSKDFVHSYVKKQPHNFNLEKLNPAIFNNDFDFYAFKKIDTIGAFAYIKS